MAPAPEAELSSPPLDGGWGWMVVFGAFISIGFSYALPKVLSVFFEEIQEDFNVSSSDIAWITSIMLAAMYAGGPVSSLLVIRFGSRPVVIVGGVMGWVSMVAAAFGNSIIHLYIFIGVIGGCGLSFNLNASLTIISEYFLTKRPIANGLAMAGSPVFQVVLAPLCQHLLYTFGWRGSLFIIGAMLLNCCVAGSLMRPVIPPSRPSVGALENAAEQVDNCNTKPKRSCMNNVNKFLDFSLFKDRGFTIYLIGNMMFFFGAYSPIVFMSANAISQGIDEYSAAFLLSIMGFADMIARPGTGLAANTKWIRPRIQYLLSFSMVLTGVCHLVCPLANGYTFLAVYAALFGIGFGMMFALTFECLMDLMGPKRFPSAIGLVTIIESCTMLLGPPTAGAMVDLFGDYKYLFFMCGSVNVTGGLFLFVMNIYNYHMLDKEKTVKDQNYEAKDKQDEEKTSGIQLEETQQAPEAAVERTEPEVRENKQE